MDTGTRIDIVSDAICPWCYIGKRQLERALAHPRSRGDDVLRALEPVPAQSRHAEARPRPRRLPGGEVRQRGKVGRARSAAITEAGAAVGLEFRTDLMTRTPNTIDAHRLIWLAGQARRAGRGDGGGVSAPTSSKAATSATTRYWRPAGPKPGCGTSRLFSTAVLADDEMRAADQAARDAGVSGVPSFFLDGHALFSGAMPAETIAGALRHGRTTLRERQRGVRRQHMPGASLLTAGPDT